MNRILLIKLFLLVGISLQAQTKMISGKIIVDDAQELINLEGFTILNTTSGAHTKANSNGLFSINVKENDELIFKQVGITERSLKVSESLINKGFIEVHVNVEVIELGETKVVKLNKNMLKNLGKEESLQEKLNKKMDLISYETKVKLNRAQNDAMSERAIRQIGGVNVIGIVGLLTGSHKKVKFTKPIEKTKHDVLLELKQFFTEYYFINDLKIPKGKIIEFLDYCYSNFNFYQLLKDNNYEEILFTLGEQAPLYLNKINAKSISNE